MSSGVFGCMKLGLAGVLTALMFLQMFDSTSAMSCTYGGSVMSVSLECPLLLQDKDKEFCCYKENSVPVCCDLNEYIRTNTPILAGIIVGVIVILLIIVICSCCCCSCCYLAQRRQQRGTVIYAPRL